MKHFSINNNGKAAAILCAADITMANLFVSGNCSDYEEFRAKMGARGLSGLPQRIPVCFRDNAIGSGRVNRRGNHA